MIWKEMKSLQKKAFVCVILLLTAALGVVLFKEASSIYVPLFPGKSFNASELSELRAYLEQISCPYKEGGEKGLLVLSKKADQIRHNVFETGIFKKETGKGFELFDTNTWIKGEKELQVLEIRALKGQLEKDLAAFEHIKSANVILDIPPQKGFNGSKFQTKASVILTLMPEARLSPSELKAITNHLAGAVRGLEAHMIAISDTKGRLYKAIDTHGTSEPFNESGLLFEEHLEGKIAELLTRLVGEGRFHTMVQARLAAETDEVLSLSIVVAIDKGVLTGYEGIEFQKEIERQLCACAKGYGLTVDPVVDFIPFDQKQKNFVHQKEKKGKSGFFITLLIVALASCVSLPLWKRYKFRKQNASDSMFRMMTKIDPAKLAASIQHEDPQTIALMLSYLEPKRAEQMMSALNSEVQEEVLFHLSEIEKEGK